MLEPNNEQLQAIVISDQIMETVKTLSIMVNDETLGVEIAPLGMYCQKTGHLIGHRNESSIFSLIKICGKDTDVSGNLYNATSMNVHPAWIFTDGESLDSLIDADPIGYACYCFGLITAQFYQTVKNTDQRLQPWAERYWALARANALMQQKGVAEISELNVALCRIITFMPDTTNYLFRRVRKFAQTPDMLAMLHATGELTGLLHEATNKALDSLGRADAWIKRTRFIDIAATPEDAARGPSNIRKQTASKRSVAEASMFAELSKLFKDEGLDLQADNLPGSTKWREKYMSGQQLREQAMLNELAQLAEITNLALPEAEDDDEEFEVETRTLSDDTATYAAQSVNCEAGRDTKTALEDNSDNSDNSTDDAEIAVDMMNAEIQPAMVEIKRAVEAEIDKMPIPQNYETAAQIPAIINELNAKPLSALAKLRMKKLEGK